MKVHESSFRDPCGFLFYEDGKLLRQINAPGREDYDRLMGSGLYAKLSKKGFLVAHRQLEGHGGLTGDASMVIEPEMISFISAPYEWCFSQLKDAALLTLEIQKTALQHGMTLKDASAYNVQFRGGRPVFIDTLSFEKYREGSPWEAYRQFCQHFLAPLALMSYTDIRLNQLLKIYIDGIPLDLAAGLLPNSTRFRFSLLMHIHLHAKAQKKYESKGTAVVNVRIPQSRLLALIHSLTAAVKSLSIHTRVTEWGEYYTFTNYSESAFSHKKELLAGFVNEIKPRTLWDLGANTGEFTRIAALSGAECIAFDIDPLAVDTLYNQIKKQKISNLLPLVMDLTNPSPALGWNQEERPGFKQHPLPDTVFALALVHHLAISNNLPFGRIAQFMCGLAENLVIEFVPKADSQVKKLLESRKDIFDGYHEEGFRKAFEEYYEIKGREKIRDSERSLFWMKRR
jgi:hypothetical protein